MALRIIHKNLLDLVNSLTASTTNGAFLVAANMRNDSKVSAHRSTGTSVTYTMTWAFNTTISGVALPATNLTSGSTIRFRLFSDEACTATLVDSGTINACPNLALDVYGWEGIPLNVNAFAHGGASKTAVWVASQSTVRGAKIDLVDSSNPAGFIDCARIVIGSYFEPTKNADFGVEGNAPFDTTTVQRNEAGDIKSDIGTMHDMMNLNLSHLPEADRITLTGIINNIGTRRNFFLSLLPGATPSLLEREHMIYGRRQNNGFVFSQWNAFSNRLTIEGW